MFQSIVNFAAASREWTVPVLFTILAIVVCSIVFPQDGSGGEFDFFGGDGGDGGGD